MHTHLHNIHEILVGCKDKWSPAFTVLGLYGCSLRNEPLPITYELHHQGISYIKQEKVSVFHEMLLCIYANCISSYD